MDRHNENVFCEYKVKSWDDCRKLLGSIQNWVFRGQSNSSWNLQTTLERGVIINDVDIRSIPNVERKIIRKFQRRASYYMDNIPEQEDLLEWLSIIQHHGGATRLLDFSYSYFIALFFSTENALQESSVYCLNKELIRRKVVEIQNEYEIRESTYYESKEYINSVLKEQTTGPLVALMEPFNMHERLSKQQGLFAIPFEGRQSFEYNLSLTFNRYRKELPVSKKLTSYEKEEIEMLNNKCALLKVLIPKEFHRSIRNELRLMNITSETLFPGIDGFSKSLSSEFEI